MRYSRLFCSALRPLLVGGALAVAFGWGLLSNVALGGDLLGPTLHLSGDDAIAPAAGVQQSPEVAAGDNGYLTVWVDDRAAITSIPTFSGGPNFDFHIGSMWDLYAARLDAQGNLIDTNPIVVCQETMNQGMPDVAWNGENYLVVWVGQEGLSCCPTNKLQAARVSPAGIVLDDPPILIENDDAVYWPTVSSDGNNWVVVWRDLDAGAGVYTLDGARIAPDGTNLDPGGVRIRRDAYNSYPVDPDLVWAGDEFLLVWEENSGTVRGQRLSSALGLLGPHFKINTGDGSRGFNPRVGTDGDGFFVAWWEDRWYGWSQMWGARVSHGGTVLDPGNLELTPYADYTNFEPSMTFDGTNYVLGYGRGGFVYDLFVTRVAVDGTVLDPDGILLQSGDYYHTGTAIATLPGQGSALLWEDARYRGSAGRGDVFACVVAPDGSAGPDYAVALGAPRQTDLKWIPNGSGYLAVFHSSTSIVSRVLVQRVTASGFPIDPEPVEVIAGEANVVQPSGAWNGSSYLITWAIGSQVFGRRLGADLGFLDAAPIPILPGNTPDVAALGGDFLVVSSHEPTDHYRLIKTMRVRGTDGALLDGSPLVVGSSYAVAPKVEEFGGRWLVVWERQPSHDNTRSDIYGNFVTSGGTAAGEFVISDDAINGLHRPAIVAGPSQGLIAWNGPDVSYSDQGIFARRILPDGTLLDGNRGLLLAGAFNAQFDVALGWDGTDYVAAFGDFRNDGEYDSHRGDIYGARVATDGTVLDPDGFVVANEFVPEMFAAIGSGDGSALIGASVFRLDPGYLAYRIAIRGMGDATTAVGSNPLALARISVSPNPAAEEVTIRLASGGRGVGSVGIFDVSGRLVRSLFEGPVPADGLALRWDARDAEGRLTAPGLYFVRVQGDDGGRAVKLIRP